MCISRRDAKIRERQSCYKNIVIRVRARAVTPRVAPAELENRFVNEGSEARPAFILRRVIGVVLYVGLFGILLFAPAGTLRWWRAWILLGVLLVVRIIGFLSMLRANRDLLRERSRLPVQKGQPLADKFLLPLFMAAFAGLVAFNSLDRFRFRLMAEPSSIVSAGGLLMFVAGWWLVTVALRTNAFAATVVRHQNERRHTVIDTGVYSVVRHPMYAGLIPVMVGMCLWLGSYAASLMVTIPIGILILRITIEERLLGQKLEGYGAYAAKVRSRLIAGIW